MCTAQVAIPGEMAPRFLRRKLSLWLWPSSDRNYFIDAFCTLSTELINTSPAKCFCVSPCIVQYNTQQNFPQKILLSEYYSLQMLSHVSVIMVAIEFACST